MQPSQYTEPRSLALNVAAMCAVVALSNYLVQFPVAAQLGAVNLADLLTWGAFTYPAAFLVTDLSNRKYGANAARAVVGAGFILAVFLSIWLATPRIALASGTAFLTAQFLDIFIFNRLKNRRWYIPPLVSSLIGSILDTAIFFSLAFSSSFDALGFADAFASGTAPLLGAFSPEVPRWVSWATGDLIVKLLVTLAMLVPYRFLATDSHNAAD